MILLQQQIFEIMHICTEQLCSLTCFNRSIQHRTKTLWARLYLLPEIAKQLLLWNDRSLACNQVIDLDSIKERTGKFRVLVHLACDNDMHMRTHIRLTTSTPCMQTSKQTNKHAMRTALGACNMDIPDGHSLKGKIRDYVSHDIAGSKVWFVLHTCLIVQRIRTHWAQDWLVYSALQWTS